MRMATSIHIAPGVLHRTLGRETVLMNLESGETFALDEQGCRIWALIEEHGDRAAVEQILAKEFDCDVGTISKDMGEFLLQLESHGLVELVGNDR